jgi:hypothetical protein
VEALAEDDVLEAFNEAVRENRKANGLRMGLAFVKGQERIDANNVYLQASAVADAADEALMAKVREALHDARRGREAL